MRQYDTRIIKRFREGSKPCYKGQIKRWWGWQDVPTKKTRVDIYTIINYWARNDIVVKEALQKRVLELQPEQTEIIDTGKTP